MKIRELLKNMSTSERAAFAARCGTSVGYLRVATSRGRNPSVALCKKLVEADPRLTLEELRPDIWGVSDEVLLSVAGVRCE
jgi:hypothetical protein